MEKKILTFPLTNTNDKTIRRLRIIKEHLHFSHVFSVNDASRSATNAVKLTVRVRELMRRCGRNEIYQRLPWTFCLYLF